MTELMPFVEYGGCLKCGAIRGRSERADLEHCPGQDSRGVVCKFGAVEHIHVRCPWCRYLWAMETFDAPVQAQPRL